MSGRKCEVDTSFIEWCFHIWVWTESETLWEKKFSGYCYVKRQSACERWKSMICEALEEAHKKRGTAHVTAQLSAICGDMNHTKSPEYDLSSLVNCLFDDESGDWIKDSVWKDILQWLKDTKYNLECDSPRSCASPPIQKTV